MNREASHYTRRLRSYVVEGPELIEVEVLLLQEAPPQVRGGERVASPDGPPVGRVHDQNREEEQQRRGYRPSHRHSRRRLAIIQKLIEAQKLIKALSF